MRIAIIFCCLVSATGTAAGVEIAVLSSRADMVTGGNALIEVSGVTRDSLQATVNGREVTHAFRRPAGSASLIALLDGLQVGTNTLEAADGKKSARIELLNHPRTGPVISGPHQEPFVCETERAGLGPPTDKHCSIETRVEHFYRTTETVSPTAQRNARSGIPPGFKPLDPAAARPPGIAIATTSEGLEVPFIVRVETGTINRAIYQIAFLHDPAQSPPDPWQRAAGWNGRLVFRFGGGCRSGFRQGATRSVLGDETSLGKGYAVAVSSLNVFGNNCNDVISAETMMMVKEHFIESFGVPVHTIGAGGSGGSMQQFLIAQNYPGLLDGIIPGESYPDTVTLVPPVTDCPLLAKAFDTSAHEWSAEQKRAVSGFASWSTCESWMRSYAPALIQPGSCAPGVGDERVYHPERRPSGVRCGLYDNMVNLVGREPTTGLARQGIDNVGVQYGLRAFNGGLITAEQFLDLNARVGGYDADANLVPERTTASPEALRVLYSAGRVNQAGGSLGSIPIIDTRGYRDPSGNIHDRVRTFIMDARLKRSNGGTANRIALTKPPRTLDLVAVMDQWLDAVAADESGGDPAERVARSRPSGLDSSCWSADGERIPDNLASSGPGGCAGLYPPSGDPRMAAGAPAANDILKCQLKPVDPGDYAQALGTDEIDRLRGIFPDGVCDYSKPGIGQVSLGGTWLRY